MLQTKTFMFLLSFSILNRPQILAFFNLSSFITYSTRITLQLYRGKTNKILFFFFFKIVTKMGDRRTLTMARKELEEMYVGIPDDSVNLSFQDLAQVMIHKKLSPSSTMEAISESGQSEITTPASLAKLPSLDFSRALHEASLNNHHHQVDVQSHHSHHHHQVDVHSHHPRHQGGGFIRSPAAIEDRSFTYDDMSHVSSVVASGLQRGRGRRRPGTPHTNICTVCSTYIYIFRHRCLVCGRVYCRQCVSIGMGEMKEGRKCMDCLGRRFSQRYINKAGNVSCCLGYPSAVKQQELKWAEKGPRTSSQAVHRHGGVVAPSSTTTGTPTSNPPSSPYSQNSHHFLPL